MSVRKVKLHLKQSESFRFSMRRQLKLNRDQAQRTELSSMWCTCLSISCHCSSSASSLGGVWIVFLGLVQTDAVLGAGWVDTDDRVQLRLGHAAFEANGDALGDLAGVRCADVEANDAVVVLAIDEHLSLIHI